MIPILLIVATVLLIAILVAAISIQQTMAKGFNEVIQGLQSIDDRLNEKSP